MISFNCLPEHETLGEFARRECVESIDIRFCRNDAEAGAGETFIATCAPAEAEFATIYGITDLGEARAIHDVHHHLVDELPLVGCEDHEVREGR